MTHSTRFAQRGDAPHVPTFCQWQALHLLNEAWLAAHLEGQDVWQFAVDIDQLHALGLSDTDLRSLLCWNYLKHAQERTTTRTRQRIFQSLKALVLPKQTCFVLTAKGREVASQSGAESGPQDGASTAEPNAAFRSLWETPRWDGTLCQLWWEKRLVKEFRRPAVNQELVLAALEEERWPPQIDDPLPQSRDIDPKARLHDTIKALNRHHLYRIIHFSGDGKGRGIRWHVLV